jgi:hypothetical protein
MLAALLQFWSMKDSSFAPTGYALIGSLMMAGIIGFTGLQTYAKVSLMSICARSALLMVAASKIKKEKGATTWFGAFTCALAAKLVVVFVWGIILNQFAPWLNLICDCAFVACMIYVQKVFFLHAVEAV